MNIIIVGGGVVGYNLAERLSVNKHHITLIERNHNLSNSIADKLDISTIAGSGTNPAILEQAEIHTADMIIAVTPNDDTNLLCCNFAKQYGVQKRIARVKSPYYTQQNTQISLKEVGVTHIIEPEKEIVSSILQYIELPGAIESANFQSDTVYLRGYKITQDMPIAHKTLVEITDLIRPAQLLIVLIIRSGKSIMPSGAERILPQDEIYAMMPSQSLAVFRKLLNIEETKIKKIVISGDSLTAIQLARALSMKADRIILVDPNEEHGRYAASILDNTEILLGDCTSVEMLQEVHIDTTPVFIAAGKDSEDNIMASILAKAEGAKEVIAVTDSDRHLQLFQALGIDHVINPRKITTQKIIENILKVPIGGLLTIKNADIEVCRYIASRNSKIINKHLQDIGAITKKSIFISGIIRNDKVIIPTGQTMIQENDEVLVICKRKDIVLVSKLFKSGIPLEV